MNNKVFLCEGESATGAARNASDPYTQAFYMFKGVTANAFKCSLSEIMENREWNELVKIMRCGIGPSFDIKKLYYDRINILTDADVDGFGISSGMLAFFYRFMRPIIEEGHLYKVFTPLYRTNSKDHEFIHNKSEMISLFHKKISKVYNVKSLFMDDYMSKTDLIDFLEKTYDYRDTLIRISDNAGRVNKFLIEVIAGELVKSGHVRSGNDFTPLDKLFSNQKFITSFMNNIQSKFPEVFLTDDKIHGVVYGKYYTIKITPRFIKKITDLIPIYLEYGYELKVMEKNNGIPRKITIGEFLDESMKFLDKILFRYKGLGELNAEHLNKSALNINNRYSVKYTIADVEKELSIFEKIHGTSKSNLESRKDMMIKYKIKRDDLDN